MSDSVYLLPTGIYLLFYFFGYLIPLLRRLSFTNFKDDLSTLKHRMRKEVSQEEALILHGNPGDDEVQEGDPENQKTNLERLRSRTLDTAFDNPLVKQAADQLRVRYPQGNYRNFEIERLPIYATYAERLTAARNMAGLFVLTGLLGTMMELEGLVTNIGGAASKGEMGEDSFLATMGSLMGDMGGAFTSSIIGLAIMLIVLVVIGLLDRIFIQTKLDRLDSTVQSDVVNQLAQLQRIHAPDTSMSDLIDQTGDLLTNFSQAVDDLSDRMVDSLSGLSDEIEEIMQEFRTFRQQHENLNQLISRLRDHTETLNGVTDSIESAGDKLEEAGDTLREPIDDFNKDINETLKETLNKHIATVNKSLKLQEKDRRNANDHLVTMKNEAETILGSIQELVKHYLEESDDLTKRVKSHLATVRTQNDEQRRAMTKELEARAEVLSSQAKYIEEALAETATALRAADSQELAAVVDQIDHEMEGTVGEMQDATDRLNATTERLDRSATSLERAAEALHKRHQNTIMGHIQALFGRQNGTVQSETDER